MAYQLSGIICSGPDEWLIRIAAVCPGDHLQWSLRELLWRYDAIQDYDTRRSCEIIAGLYNVQRAKTSDKVWSWQDFHPRHQQPTRRPSGREVLASHLAQFAPGEVQWLEGYGPEILNGK